MPDFASLKVTQLKAELKKRGLAQAGLKAELIIRLETYDAERAAASAHAEKGEGEAAEERPAEKSVVKEPTENASEKDGEVQPLSDPVPSPAKAAEPAEAPPPSHPDAAAPIPHSEIVDPPPPQETVNHDALIINSEESRAEDAKTHEESQDTNQTTARQMTPPPPPPTLKMEDAPAIIQEDAAGSDAVAESDPPAEAPAQKIESSVAESAAAVKTGEEQEALVSEGIPSEGIPSEGIMSGASPEQPLDTKIQRASPEVQSVTAMQGASPGPPADTTQHDAGPDLPPVAADQGSGPEPALAHAAAETHPQSQIPDIQHEDIRLSTEPATAVIEFDNPTADPMLIESAAGAADPAAPVEIRSEYPPSDMNGAGRLHDKDPSGAMAPPRAADMAQDFQKRKRRSVSPSPDPKRARPSNGYGYDSRRAASPTRKKSRRSPAPDTARETRRSLNESERGARSIQPSIHPTTSALYISDFMRPLRPADVQDHLRALAQPADADDQAKADDVIIDFYLNSIRTHAFVVFSSAEAASRVRNALHRTVWPNERERKPLWVDFIPPEKLAEWRDMQRTVGRGAPLWEVVYGDDRNGGTTARLVEVDKYAPRPAQRAAGRRSDISRDHPPPPPPPPPPSALDGVNAIPIGLRGGSSIPTGPRNLQQQQQQQPTEQQQPPPPSSRFDEDRAYDHSRPIHVTKAGPPIRWQPVSQDIIHSREDQMRKYLIKDTETSGPAGPGSQGQKNRYTFYGPQLFDRGVENFEGIRPPAREKEIQLRRRGRYDPDDPKLRWVPPEERTGYGRQSSRRPYTSDFRDDGDRHRFNRGGGGRGSGGGRDRPRNWDR